MYLITLCLGVHHFFSALLTCFVAAKTRSCSERCSPSYLNLGRTRCLARSKLFSIEYTGKWIFENIARWPYTRCSPLRLVFNTPVSLWTQSPHQESESRHVCLHKGSRAGLLLRGGLETGLVPERKPWVGLTVPCFHVVPGSRGPDVPHKTWAPVPGVCYRAQTFIGTLLPVATNMARPSRRGFCFEQWFHAWTYIFMVALQKFPLNTKKPDTFHCT